eukprot:8038453-Prorocentrum_lima.AAC.1
MGTLDTEQWTRYLGTLLLVLAQLVHRPLFHPFSPPHTSIGTLFQMCSFSYNEKLLSSWANARSGCTRSSGEE